EMPPLEVSVSGMQKFLTQLDESSAIGPDDISPRVLKRCSGIISAYLCDIFQHSL
ncbi:hypothetical protein IscW_ISCW015019, partial [Ixodes scapularis]